MVLESVGQSLVQFDAAGLGTDPGLLSDALMELGATSVSVQDSELGTSAETPIFRHHSASPTWRGGRGGGEDPALGRMDSRGVVRGEGEDGESAAQQQEQQAQEWSPSEFWEKSLVTASFPSSWDLQQVAEMLEVTLGLEAPPGYVVADGFDDAVDWTSKVQESWPPILAGDVLIAFPWHGEADAAAVAPTGFAHKVVLEGGVAFGTGEHPTTRLCLEWLQRGDVLGKAEHQRRRVLDYGSGSGILGLSAARLGAKEVVGVEVDRDAIAAAHRNADINDIDRCAFHCHLPPADIAATEAGGAHVTLNAIQAAAEPDCTALPAATEPFDLTVANILAGPLCQLAPTIAALTSPAGGRLALSGILEGQEDRILEAYRPFFPDIAVERQREEWLLVTGTRGAAE